MSCSSNNPITTIRFGIIGCAKIANKMARAIVLAPNATIVAIGSECFDEAALFITRNGLDASTTKAFGSYEAVIDHLSVDAVYVALPTSMHCTWAVAAARKGKHVLLEVPTALSVEELDQIQHVCIENQVQFMDSTMWLHHPRTEQMKQLITDKSLFGDIKRVESIFTYYVDDISVRNLDAMGALGDAGWYCISSILWAFSYKLPICVRALSDPVKNDSGILLSCGAVFCWSDRRVASMQCSYLTHLTMQMTVIGMVGTLQVTDFVIPYKEGKAKFQHVSNAKFTGQRPRGWNKVPTTNEVITELPQEARMVQKFASLVKSIKEGKEPNMNWSAISRKTQQVLDAVKQSLAEGNRYVKIIG